MNNDWEHIVLRQTIEAHRTGWAGVWDALKSALTGEDRLTAPTDLTLEWHQKPRGDGHCMQGVRLIQGREPETSDE